MSAARSERSNAPLRPRAAATARGAGRWVALGLGLVPALLLTSALAGSTAPASWSVPGSGSPPSYDSGQFSAVFPAPAPGVELLQDANSTVAAELVVDHVLEIQPGNSDHPIVVQLATPTSATPFNGSYRSAGESAFTLSLHGTVPVVRTGVPLWTTPLGLPPNVSGPGLLPVTGGATLSVGYSLSDHAGAPPGLALSFNIHGWPWLDSHDLLGLEMQFVDDAAIGFDACGANPLLSSSPGAGCNGTVLAPGAILWNASAVSSVVARDPGGLAAAFVWDPEAQLGAGAPAPVTAGSYFASANTTRVLLAAAGGGSGNVTTSAQMLIALPPLPVGGPAVLHGDAAAYAATVAIAGGAALAGIVAYRRRDRRFRASL